LFAWAYQLRPALSLTGDVDKGFSARQVFYRDVPDQMPRTILNGATISAGFSGRF